MPAVRCWPSSSARQAGGDGGNADSTLRKSEGKPNNAQWRKDVASDVASVADFLHLTVRGGLLDSAMGRSDAMGPSLDELAAQRGRRAGGVRSAGLDHPASLTPDVAHRPRTTRLAIWIGGDSVSQVLGQQVAKASEATGSSTRRRSTDA